MEIRHSPVELCLAGVRGRDRELHYTQRFLPVAVLLTVCGAGAEYQPGDGRKESHTARGEVIVQTGFLSCVAEATMCGVRSTPRSATREVPENNRCPCAIRVRLEGFEPPTLRSEV